MINHNGLTGAIRTSVLVTCVSAMVAFAGAGSAQEVTPEHLKQARSAIAAIGATNQFDTILPQAADALKAEMIQKDPNLEDLIGTTVDNEVLSLAARRADLENEAARVYAKVFSEAELKAISDFYSTDVGKKLISDGPIASRELVKAANIWQAGIARDLAQSAGDKLKAATPAEAPKEEAPKEEAPKQEAPKE